MGEFKLVYERDNGVRTSWSVSADDAFDLLPASEHPPAALVPKPALKAVHRRKRRNDGMVSTREMMAALGIKDPGTPQKWRKQGCPAIRDGVGYRWDVEVVKAWRAARDHRRQQPSTRFEDRLGQHIPDTP